MSIEPERCPLDFTYEISDERLLAYSALPIIERLCWLDAIRQFTLAVRAAREVEPPDASRSAGGPQQKKFPPCAK